MALLVETSAVRWRDVLKQPWQSTRLCLAILCAWCVVLFPYGLTAGELWRTEGLRALVAQEMMNSGNWLVPTLYEQPMFTKPPGMYIAIVLCSYLQGAVSEWSARLPSVLAATC